MSGIAEVKPKMVLIMITSADKLGDHPTGVWLEEVASPYYAFLGAGLQVVLGSINGGKPTVDDASLQGDALTETAKRFQEDADAQAKFAATMPLSDVQAADYQAIFLPGGHGTCVDFPDNEKLIALIEDIYKNNGIVSSVCHGPTSLVNVKINGEPIVKGKKVCAFSDEEEKMVKLDSIVPFMLETRLRELGADYQVGEAWAPKAVADGRLITGQNPASSEEVAKLVVAAFNN